MFPFSLPVVCGGMATRLLLPEPETEREREAVGSVTVSQ